MRTKHVVEVLALYKRILRLQQGLPKQLQDLGTNYVRDEFKRHKGVNSEEAAVFLREWAVSISGTIFHKSTNFCSFLEIRIVIIKSIISQRNRQRRRRSELDGGRYQAHARRTSPAIIRIEARSQ